MNPRRPLALFLAILGLLAATTPAQQGVTVHEACTLRSVSRAELSPDGGMIAYETSLPRDPRVEDGGARRELRVMAVGDEAPGRLYLSESFSGWRWHPNGGGILFVARRSGDDVTSLYHLPIDGGEARRLFVPEGQIRDWDVSVDGEMIVYTAKVEAETAPEVARGYDQVIFGTTEAEVALRVAQLDGSKDVRVELDGAPWGPAISPDGKTVAFWRSPTSSVDDSYMHKRLWVLDIAGLKASSLIDNPGKVGDLAWSPDSTRIAFISAIDKHDPKESTLMVADARTGSLKILTPEDFEGHVSSPSWHLVPGAGGDSLQIFFLVDRGTISEVMYQSPEGGEMKHPAKTVAVEGEDREPVIWRSLAMTRTDRGFVYASVAESARHPRELYVQGRRATFSNPETIDSEEGRKLGRQETIRYTARDGLEIEGVLIWPTDYQEGRRYPLICMIHGGPEAHYSDGWLTAYSMPGQVAAAKGYFVFHPNYRSSTGRGVAFSKAGQGRSAREEFDDIVDGVDHLIERGLVDGKKVGITGGSYGGYASAWGATYYSDRFAASVMFVGISEQLSKIFTTDIPDESFLVHWRMRPWGNWMKYLEASPIYYIERAKTPILILHGEQDPRVPVAQSIELYRALKMRGGVPTRLVLYPREQHGNRNAAARFDYGLRMMRWFDSYLMGKGEMPPEKVEYGLN